MVGLALIPSVGATPLLVALVDRLADEDIQAVIVDNYPGPDREDWTDTLLAATRQARYLWRPDWGIYRSWNFGIRAGRRLKCPVLILNDDIILPAGSASTMIRALGYWPEFGLLGFNYGAHVATPPGVVIARGTYRNRGIGGFAFGVNPGQCALVDERFKWWGGDDDLIQSTLRLGYGTGVLSSATVEHPTPSLTANANPGLLPPDWAEHDRSLLLEKWGQTW